MTKITRNSGTNVCAVENISVTDCYVDQSKSWRRGSTIFPRGHRPLARIVTSMFSSMLLSAHHVFPVIPENVGDWKVYRETINLSGTIEDSHCTGDVMSHRSLCRRIVSQLSSRCRRIINFPLSPNHRFADSLCNIPRMKWDLINSQTRVLLQIFASEE